MGASWNSVTRRGCGEPKRKYFARTAVNVAVSGTLGPGGASTASAESTAAGELGDLPPRDAIVRRLEHRRLRWRAEAATPRRRAATGRAGNVRRVHDHRTRLERLGELVLEIRRLASRRGTEIDASGEVPIRERDRFAAGVGNAGWTCDERRLRHRGIGPARGGSRARC
jgi:hypothetical protein